MGKCFGFPRKLYVGGWFERGIYSGTRAIQSNNAPILVSNINTTRGCNGNYYYPGATKVGNNLFLNGYQWSNLPIYNTSVDSLIMGECAGLVRRSMDGGHWSSAEQAGTRSTICDSYTVAMTQSISVRGCSH